MRPLQLKRANDQIRYSLMQLVQLRRQILRRARSLSPGPERNECRQIAASLRSLLGNKPWLDAHTVANSATECRVYTVGSGGHFFKTIELDRRDDAAAIGSAKQLINSGDIEPWQRDGKVATFEHKPGQGPVNQLTKPAPDVYDLHAKAAMALDEARAMRPGAEKTEALKRAGLLRNAADIHGLFFAKRGRPPK